MTSVQDWANLVAALAIVLAAFNIITLQRVVRRQQDQLGRLTRRVWRLEGSPDCECRASDVEA